jgi:hypothetical protein
MDQQSSDTDVSDTLLLNRLLSATGAPDGARGVLLEEDLRTFRRWYKEEWPGATEPQAERRTEVLRKMVTHSQERLDLWKQLGPGGTRDIDQYASRLEVNRLAPLGESFLRIEQLLYMSILNVLIERHFGYRKTPIRRLVIEPFLDVLEKHGLWETAEDMTKVMAALYDFLGVPQKDRPTDAGMRTIIREYKQEQAEDEEQAADKRREKFISILEKLPYKPPKKS